MTTNLAAAEPEPEPVDKLDQHHAAERALADAKLREHAGRFHHDPIDGSSWGRPPWTRHPQHTPSWEELYRRAKQERDSAREQLRSLTSAITAAQKAVTPTGDDD